MHIDELHKFSDGTLNDVRSALDDTLKIIWMKYLSQTIWREVDRERVGAMIQAIDRQPRNCRRLSHSDYAFAEVNNHDNVDNNLMNQVVQSMPSSEQSSVVNNSETEITSDSNIIPYSQYVKESQQAAVQNSNSSA
ncbi:hypothetical protein Tco_0413355 [Tanacetum coccineum]